MIEQEENLKISQTFQTWIFGMLARAARPKEGSDE
jgi:hypothetical protein